MLKRIAPFGGLAAAVLGVVALGGCPVTTVCSPTDLSCQTPCVVGDTRPQCVQNPTTGTMSITWTVNGQPASTACAPANAANVRFSLGGAAPAIEPCATGARVFAGLAAGSVTLQADLIDAAGNVLNQYPTTPQTIVAGGATNVVIAFTVGSASVGGVKFNWTVGGQPAATACPAGSQVKFESTAAPSTPATSTVACTAGLMEIGNLPAGSYTFKGSLLDSAGAASALVENLTVTVNAGQVAEFSPAVDFVVGATPQTGAAVLAWTVNGGQKCLAGAAMNVTVSGGPTTPNPQPTTTCETYTLRIPNLQAGTYSFNLVIPNPDSGQPGASVDIPNIAVAAGSDASVNPVDITCAFCPQ